jgi:hypothetical protein
MTEVASGGNIDHNFGEIQVWKASGAPLNAPYTRIGLVSVKEFELPPKHVVAVKNGVALFGHLSCSPRMLQAPVSTSADLECSDLLRVIA